MHNTEGGKRRQDAYGHCTPAALEDIQGTTWFTRLWVRVFKAPSGGGIGTGTGVSKAPLMNLDGLCFFKEYHTTLERHWVRRTSVEIQSGLGTPALQIDKRPVVEGLPVKGIGSCAGPEKNPSRLHTSEMISSKPLLATLSGKCWTRAVQTGPEWNSPFI